MGNVTNGKRLCEIALVSASRVICLLRRWRPCCLMKTGTVGSGLPGFESCDAPGREDVGTGEEGGREGGGGGGGTKWCCAGGCQSLVV